MDDVTRKASDSRASADETDKIQNGQHRADRGEDQRHDSKPKVTVDDHERLDGQNHTRAGQAEGQEPVDRARPRSSKIR